MNHYSLFFGLLLLVLSLSQTIISQNLAGSSRTFPFKLSALVLSTEVAKVVIAGASVVKDYVREQGTGKRAFVPKTRTVAVMAVPALLYTISNTLLYTTIALMGSTNAQIWLNIRIVITAVLCRIAVKKPMTVLQWMSIFLLLVGVISCQDQAGRTSPHAITLQAVLCLLIQTTCASLAGVYQEVLFKNNNDERIAVKSLALYFWTCLLSYAQWRRESVTDHASFFQGFTTLTWISLSVNALYGQAVALTLFFCDNMVKVFATSLGPIAAIMLDALYFGVGVELAKVLGATVVTLSTIMFYCKHDWLLIQDSEALSSLLIRSVNSVQRPTYTEF